MANNPKPRPMSPHLQVYKPQLTSMLSILHRATGVFLALGTVLVVMWLSSLAQGEQTYAQFGALASHPFVQLLLLGWCFSISYHLCNGIRHLFWDVGAGLELSSVYRSGVIVMVAALVLTAFITVVAYRSMGGVA